MSKNAFDIFLFRCATFALVAVCAMQAIQFRDYLRARDAIERSAVFAERSAVLAEHCRIMRALGKEGANC